MNLLPWRAKKREDLAPAPVERLQDEMSHVIDRFFRDPWAGFEPVWPGFENWGPAVDVKEDDQAYTVRAELPGVDAKDIHVELHDGVLTVSGEKKQEATQDEGGMRRTECRYGRFARSVPLAEDVDEGKIAAEHKNGVLTVKLPKLPGTSAKRIEVRNG